jgi:hypothetical protein
MARTVAFLAPGGAETKTTTFPAPGRSSDASGARPYLAYDAATDEAAYWTLAVPQGFTSPFTAIISYAMASATTNAVVWDVTVEAITSGDGTPDTDAAESLDTANTATADTVPGTAGLLKQVSVALSNGDSAAAADYLRIRIRRVGSSGSDTATGDAFFFGCELRDAT